MISVKLYEPPKKKIIIFDGSNKDDFPFATILLLFLLYFIGFFTIDFHKLLESNWKDFSGQNILKNDIRHGWTLQSNLEWQWSIFTYHLIHFAVVHFSYVGVLLFYYIPGLERATNKRFIFIAFYLIGVLGGILNGFLLFFIIQFFPGFNKWVLTNYQYMGSSIGVWGLIGFTGPISRGRRLYWFGIVLLLVIEFFLKIIRKADITANIVHIIVFLITWIIGSTFIEYGDEGKEVGGYHYNNEEDRLFVILIAIHSIGMFLYFYDQLSDAGII